MSLLDALIIVVSIVTVVVVGLWASRRQEHSARGYFLASGRMPWWIIGSAFVSTSVSSEQIVGTIGAAYERGMGIANWELWSLPVYLPLIVFFIPVYLKNRVTTMPDFLNRRYGPLCADIYSYVMLIAYVFVFLVPVLYSGSLAFSQLIGPAEGSAAAENALNWRFHAVLWTTIVLVGLYTIKGGLASVMWTDAAQCLMLLGGGLVLYFLALGRIPGGIWGGWQTMMQANPERFHLYLPPEDQTAPFLGLLCGTLGVFLFYQATNQVMIQRVLGARSTWDGIMGIIFAGMINFLRPLVTCFLGFVVYHWIHEMKQAAPLADKDLAFPFALRTFGPEWGLRGIILAGFLAAVMSTISALANSTATIFSLDVYKKVIRPGADDRQLVRVGRLASLAALLAAGLMAPSVSQMGGVFRYFQTGVTFLAAPFVSVILLGILWRRTNYSGGIFGTAGGVVIAAAAMAFYLLQSRFGTHLHWLYVAFFAQVVIMAGIVVVSLATPAPSPEQCDPFLWRPSLLRGLQDGERQPWYRSLTLWFTVYAAVWICLYWRWR